MGQEWKYRKSDIKKMEVREIIITKNSASQWGEVELYRWQTGELPNENSKLDIPLGLENLANAMLADTPETRPSTYSIYSVLMFVADYLKETQNGNRG